MSGAVMRCSIGVHEVSGAVHLSAPFGFMR